MKPSERLKEIEARKLKWEVENEDGFPINYTDVTWLIKRVNYLTKAMESASSLARYIIERAQIDKWTSPGLEFGCSKIELDLTKALEEE